MPTRDQPKTIRNFQGLNRRDGGDKIFDSEFINITNSYQKTKGLFFKREGSTSDLTASQLSGVSRINGITRHYSPQKDRISIYHCEPNTTARTEPLVDLGLAEISGGDLFSGGSVTAMRFCYTYVGWGSEGFTNSKFRTGYVSTPVDSWSNPGHQSITVSSNTKGVRITVPTFPAGVKSVNVFAARGTSTQMTYIGSVFQSGGTLDFLSFLAIPAAFADTMTSGWSAIAGSGGSLPTGTYYVTLYWLAGYDGQDNNPGPNVFGNPAILATAIPVQVGGTSNSITVTLPAGASTNGATYAGVMIAKKGVDTPFVFAGIVKNGGNFSINSIPRQTNAASDVRGYFYTGTSQNEGKDAKGRFGLMYAKNKDGEIYEILPSRSDYVWCLAINRGGPDQISGTWPGIFYLNVFKTKSDYIATVGPFDWDRKFVDPAFTYLNGMSYFVNGGDPIWMVDGHIACMMYPETGTTMPPFAKYIQTFENGLQVAAGTQVYASNAAKPRNWAAGGSGTAIRFVTMGDAFGDDLTALGVFGFVTDANNDPRSFFVGFKKNACWFKDTFPDPSSGVGSPMQQLDGRVGCIAFRSLASTPLGLMFVGGDGNIYLIRGSGAPVPVGGKVKPLLEHLVENDDLARLCTAVFHDNHYKLSYPSSASSTTNDAQIWADLRTEEGDRILWTGPHTGINVGPQIVQVGEGDNMYRIGCVADGSGSARLDDPSTFQDLGADRPTTWESKIFRFGAEMHSKRYMGMHLDAYYDTAFTHDLTLEFFADGDYSQINRQLSAGSGVWDSSNFDQARWGDAMYMPIPLLIGDSNLNGRTFRYRLSHNGNAQFILAAATILMQPERRMIV